MRILTVFSSFLVDSIPSEVNQRNEMEDTLWGDMESELKDSKASTLRIPANTPTFFSIATQKISQQKLDDIFYYSRRLVVV